MSVDAETTLALESVLVQLLRQGTRIASALILLGLMAGLFGQSITSAPAYLPSATAVVEAGLALFILLPVVRVGLMVLAFVGRRDYRFGVIAATVLGIILVGYALNSRLS